MRWQIKISSKRLKTKKSDASKRAPLLLMEHALDPVADQA